MSLLDVRERADDSVVKRRAAARVDPRKSVVQLLGVAGEIAFGVEIIFVIEVDDESLVLRIAGIHERKRRGIYLSALFAHAAAIVNDKAHGHGNIVTRENGNFCSTFVFENAKAALIEAGNKFTAAIRHSHVKNH